MPTFSPDYLAISAQLTVIADTACACKSVAEVDVQISFYQEVLNGKQDESGTLKAIFEYRNSLVSLKRLEDKNQNDKYCES